MAIKSRVLGFLNQIRQISNITKKDNESVALKLYIAFTEIKIYGKYLNSNILWWLWPNFPKPSGRLAELPERRMDADRDAALD
jgi:hypothetical protein